MKKKFFDIFKIAMTLFLTVYINTGSVYAQISQEKPKVVKIPERVESKKSMEFDDVLRDIFDEFAYDLKSAFIPGLTQVSVRQVLLGDNIPNNYSRIVEFAMLEKLRAFSRSRVVECLQCHVKKSYADSSGRLIIAYSQQIPEELDKISHENKIETWFDGELLYDETIMIFNIKAFDAKSKELLWAKTYTSDSIYRDAMPLTEAEEQTIDRLMGTLSLGYSYHPNIKNKHSHMLTLNLRLGEYFNKGRDALGGKFSFLVLPSLLVSKYTNYSGDPAADPDVKEKKENQVNPYKYAVGSQLFYMHSFAYLKPKSSLSELDILFQMALGAIMCPGYVTFYGTVGPLFKMGNSIILETGISYLAPSTISISSKYSLSTPGGFGFDLSFGFLF